MLTSARLSRSALVLLGLFVASLGQAQDLAAVARKEKDRRAKVTKPAKVLTEDDGKEAATKNSGSVTALTGEGAAAAMPASPSTTGVAESERAAWKARSDNAKKAVEAAEQRLSNLQTEVAAYRSDTEPVSAADAQDPMRLQKRDAHIFEMNKQIEAQKVAIVAAKKALADFEEEARRAGVPPGWLR